MITFGLKKEVIAREGKKERFDYPVLILKARLGEKPKSSIALNTAAVILFDAELDDYFTVGQNENNVPVLAKTTSITNTEIRSLSKTLSKGNNSFLDKMSYDKLVNYFQLDDKQENVLRIGEIQEETYELLTGEIVTYQYVTISSNEESTEEVAEINNMMDIPNDELTHSVLDEIHGM